MALIPSRRINDVYSAMPAVAGQPPSRPPRGLVMGRHKAMTALATPNHEPAPAIPVAADAPAATRRLHEDDLTDAQRDRYQDLRRLTIRVPEGPLRDAALQQAALVWARTPAHAPAADAKEFQILARFLHAEALTFQHVDVTRALTRSSVDRWLETESTRLSLSSRRTYRVVLYAAGRVIHPREFPALRSVTAPRAKGSPAADPGTAEAIYAITPGLPPKLRSATLLVVDLASGAGLRAPEIRELTGDDVTTVHLPQGRTLVTVRVRRRGVVDRVVPVVDPGKAARIAARAADVGPQPLMARTGAGKVEHNAVNRVSERLTLMGYPPINAAALRHRWILDLASTPGVPATALLALAGVCDLRVLADRADQLPSYTPVELAELLTATTTATTLAEATSAQGGAA